MFKRIIILLFLYIPLAIAAPNFVKRPVDPDIYWSACVKISEDKDLSIVRNWLALFNGLCKSFFLAFNFFKFYA